MESRAPCSGDVIHNALQLLMTTGSIDSPLTPHTPSSARLGQKAWSIPDFQNYLALQQQQNGTTSVTLSPAPSLDGHGGSPHEHNHHGHHHHSHNGHHNGHHGHSSGSTSSSGTVALLSSASSSASNGSSGGGNHSDDSEYDSVGDSPERSPGTTQSLSPPPNNSSNGPTNGSTLHPQQHLASSTNGHLGAESLVVKNSGSSNSNGSGNNSGSQTKDSPGTKSGYSNGVAKLSVTGGAGNNSTAGEGGEYNNSEFCLCHVFYFQ